jgi:hypothetical protein
VVEHTEGAKCTSFDSEGGSRIEANPERTSDEIIVPRTVVLRCVFKNQDGVVLRAGSAKAKL